MFVRTVQARITEREVQNTLATLETVANSVPFFQLRFRPTTAAVMMVLNEVGSSSNVAERTRDVASGQGVGRSN
jgi:hypothetical protein